MAKSKSMNRLGSWAFLIGVVLAVVFGLIGSLSPGLVWFLVLLGIIIGLLNIAEHEVSQFLMAGTVLVIVSVLGQNVVANVSLFDRILQALSILFVPATIIVALKHVFSLARN